jgi:pyruvate formate lyase activating enzyme
MFLAGKYRIDSIYVSCQPDYKRGDGRQDGPAVTQILSTKRGQPTTFLQSDTKDRRNRRENSKESAMDREAMLYEKREGGDVHCFLCSHHCRIKEGDLGFCRVRKNAGGVLKTLAYGKAVAAHIDPIEKKPLYHFLPGSLIYSVAAMGCNFHCGFCQNWQISQIGKEGMPELPGRQLLPEQIVLEAQQTGSKSIAYTYTEPTIFFEYAYDTCRLAKDAGLANVFITNGFMTREALETISDWLDACNIDLKSFSNEFYKSVCQGRLKPVLASIRSMKALGIWVEVTTLVVPDQNDSEDELRSIADFVAGVSPDIPWHISRFHPGYEYGDSYPTPPETLRKAYKIGKDAGLRFIYIGNLPGEEKDTLCPSCNAVVIRRGAHFTSENRLKGSQCPECGAEFPGIFAL